MSLPKKVKKNIELTNYRTLYPRRQELFDNINEGGTNLPKSILHADLDGGFLQFVRDELKCIVDGKTVPTVDIIVTMQNWAQFTQTWKFQDLDKNASPPFITVVRTPEIKYGSLPQLQYTIPNRRQFYYATVPGFDGNRYTWDVYKIPQPVPVDIKYQLKIICNRMRELNQLNRIILQKFSSRQAYTVIKGHYIPIIWDDVQDESVVDIEKRKYYIQSYSFTMMGFLLDEDEFEVSPAVERILQLVEVDNRRPKTKRKRGNYEEKPDVIIEFNETTTHSERLFYDMVDLSLYSTENVANYEIYINNEYYGSDIKLIQVNEKDTVKFVIQKTDSSLYSRLNWVRKIIP